jgi:hypothetical protein
MFPPPLTPHLNIYDLAIRATPEKGRGVFGKRFTVVPRGMASLNANATLGLGSHAENRRGNFDRDLSSAPI